MAGWRGLYGIAGPLDGTDARSRALETLESARTLLSAGVRVVQLRDKAATGSELVEIAQELLGLCRSAGAKLIVNDRLDVALAAGADGVHVGQEDLPIHAIREALARVGVARDRFVVGLSTHTEDEVRTALTLGVDYVGFGPIYGTATKSDALTPRGVEALARAVRAAAGLPVVAIGGLTLGAADELAATGVPMVAVIADIHRSLRPADQARAWHRRFGGAD